MIALIENLRSALSGAFGNYRTKFNQQLDLASLEAARAESELVQLQAKLRDISGSRDLSRQSILREINTLRQKLQTAIMKRASDESLYEATTNQIAEEQARRKKLVEDDPITREFKSILDVHERRLKETQKLYESGRASAADLEDIKEKIIRARIDLAKRQEEVSNPPGGIVLGSYNNELANLSTKIALARQEINSLEEQLKEAEDLLGKADSYELLSLKADIARQNLEETLLWRARLGRNIRSIQPPDVTVIGAE
jgi:chromosome segregation ATPase